jgi:two-component system sensor histidine kinase BaeS
MRRLSHSRLFSLILSSFLLTLFLFVAVMSVSFLLGYRRSVAGWGREKLGSVEAELRKALADLLARSETAEGAPEGLAQRIEAIVPPGVPVDVYDAEMRELYVGGRPHMMGGRGMMHGTGRMGMGFGRPDAVPRGAPERNTPRTDASGTTEYRPEVFQQAVSRSPGSRSHANQRQLQRLEREGRLVGFYRIGVPGFGIDSANARFLSSMRKTIWRGAAFSLPLAFLLALILSRRLSLSARKVAGGIQEMARGNLGVRVPEHGAEEIVAIARAANELAGKLGREESLRRQWAGDVAHDLRTPIAALRAQFEGMRDGVLDTSAQRIARNLRELSRIETLVDDLAELTRLESPEMRIRPVPVDTALLCGELKARFEPDLAAKGISARWECGVPELVADENLLLRALSNFLSNAVRHTPEGGKISTVFESRAEGARNEGYAVTVRNTGEAIPRDEIDKLFQRLYRGEYARKTAGSGLGLTIALKIAELHGGTVAIESREGLGTSVTMTIADLHGEDEGRRPEGGTGIRLSRGPGDESPRAEHHR